MTLVLVIVISVGNQVIVHDNKSGKLFDIVVGMNILDDAITRKLPHNSSRLSWKCHAVARYFLTG